jgi:type III secretory pathway component EscV
MSFTHFAPPLSNKQRRGVCVPSVRRSAMTVTIPVQETRKKVNGVEYIVRSFFKEDARETAEQKILRLVKQCVSEKITITDTVVSRSN